MHPGISQDCLEELTGTELEGKGNRETGGGDWEKTGYKGGFSKRRRKKRQGGGRQSCPKFMNPGGERGKVEASKNSHPVPSVTNTV